MAPQTKSSPPSWQKKKLLLPFSFSDAEGTRGNRTIHVWLLYALVLILSTYILLDIYVNHMHSIGFLGVGIGVPAAFRAQGFTSQVFKHNEWEAMERNRSDLCGTREGFLEQDQDQVENPWRQMKWIGEAAACPVRGHLIEKLDDSNNFRRGFALRFADDVEDKTHILPWLLPSKAMDLHHRERRVLLDLGANAFSTSLTWFLRMYPCDFTEIHAFEVDSKLLQKPNPPGFDEERNVAQMNPSSFNVRVTPQPPQWMVDRIQLHYSFVSDGDDKASNAVNITRFMKEELRLKATDTVVVKMDIEGSEWPILRRWLSDPEMPLIVDELFVEIHYNHPSMWDYHWFRFGNITRQNAKELLADLRWHGFYAHFWP
uniref:Uncharacterized protein n=1 Tax=Picea sitchensis TaxID=3332 RepID=B8LNQ1_PICSI|nr:unknown [Picea sitchensis]